MDSYLINKLFLMDIVLL